MLKKSLESLSSEGSEEKAQQLSFKSLLNDSIIETFDSLVNRKIDNVIHNK